MFYQNHWCQSFFILFKAEILGELYNTVSWPYASYTHFSTVTQTMPLNKGTSVWLHVIIPLTKSWQTGVSFNEVWSSYKLTWLFIHISLSKTYVTSSFDKALSGGWGMVESQWCRTETRCGTETDCSLLILTLTIDTSDNYRMLPNNSSSHFYFTPHGGHKSFQQSR